MAWTRNRDGDLIGTWSRNRHSHAVITRKGRGFYAWSIHRNDGHMDVSSFGHETSERLAKRAARAVLERTE